IDYMISTLYDLSQKSGRPAIANGPFNADPELVPPGPGKSNYSSDLSKEGIRTDYWNWGTGFISGYPPDQFIMLENGASYGGGNDQVWAPFYTLHKILAGLLDCYEAGHNDQALEIAQNMASWVYQRLSKLSPAQRSAMWDRYIAGEYGGMNEVMARLYLLTGENKFMVCAGYFDNVKFFFGDHQRTSGLACNYDTIGGRHANQHIPQITGALAYYLAGGDLAYYKVARNFWKKVTGNYSYSIGGVAGASNPNNAECFTAEPDSLFANGFSAGGQNETCATYNMLKLSRLLFLFEQKPEYMDYYERALYNHILASVDKDNPGNTYHVPLNPGAYKSFSNARMDGFTCCNGTALESGTKLQDSIYFRSEDDSALYVNLYIPSTLNWQQKGINLSQKTDLPYSNEVKIFVTAGSGSFALFLRVPYWSVNGFTVSINGNVQQADARPGSYCKLEKHWQQGDIISLQMPMSFHLMPVMDRPDLASVFYGPVLLAVQESEPLANWRRLTLNLCDLDSCFAGDPKSLTFTSDSLTFKPFYESYGCHSVYLDIDNITEE
ncbi:MAG: glycoside hydrolase family 127 protein, partial [Sedimentisphaerales bacterium]|nr:glycoside hydrolase family 127 protein [Sedimentisphaerales bacterium]